MRDEFLTVQSADLKVSRETIPPRIIFAVATALGFFSGFQAYYFVSTFTEWPASFPLLLALNLGYWYSWAMPDAGDRVAARDAFPSSGARGSSPSPCTCSASSSPRSRTSGSPSARTWRFSR